MRSLDDWQRPGPTPRQRRIDLVIGLVVVAAALFHVMLSRSVGLFVWGVERSAAEHLAFAFAVTVPLIWRRSHPEIVLVVIAVVFVAGQVREAQEIQFASGAIFAAIYAAGAWGRDRGRSRWLRITVIAVMFGWLAIAWLIAAESIDASDFADGTGELPPLLSALVAQVLMNLVVFGFSYFFGETAWLSARREAALVEQAEQLREARAAAEERAVVTERMRIARELHDVVAHHVSVMGIQAAAARRAMDRNADTARDALTSVEEGARTAVDELHRMLGALRTADEPVSAPSAGVDRVAELLDRVREAGLTAEYAVYGDPVPLPDSTSQAAYRIVQEAVTNALKHAGATTIDVRLRYLARQLEVDVADDGRGAAAAAGDRGMGLIGMRERVALLGGAVETGNRTAGGYRVRARLPLVPAQRVGASS
ncbi:histidine kinase [Paractinoplanes hotanensis]|uniref:histidine kinase n=1 Tax=Paractinoplanes hotanensis TaxID=2906497 RepID=A0ABT0YBB0_9ACTN|nr:histidine kinase [Actinoplanes hotanensis]MCM4083333.1 histidine kinase [Actinoplanes hotanensis]